MFVLAELEHVWHRPLALDAASAATALCLLAASELRSWARRLEQAGESPRAARQHAVGLGTRLAIVAGVTFLLVVAGRLAPHATALGAAGAFGGLAVFAAVALRASALRR